MNPAPRVSVVLPVYNGERFVGEAVDSILQQTYPDFELIIVDDGSTDDTWQIIQSCAERDARVIPMRCPDNVGVYPARNLGIGRARGEYIAVQDADDVSYPERLALQVEYLDAHPHVGAVGSQANRIDERGQVLSLWKVPADHETLRATLLYTNPLPHTTLMARRSLVDKLKGYATTNRYSQDYDFWWRLSNQAEVVALRDVLAGYRSVAHPGRITTSKKRQQAEDTVAVTVNIMRGLMRGGGLDEAAYTRFWMTCRGFPLLESGDVLRLQPVWNFLAADPAYAAVMGPRLLSCSTKIMRSQPLQAAQLMLIVRKLFKLNWKHIVRHYARHYAPPGLLKMRRRLFDLGVVAGVAASLPLT